MRVVTVILVLGLVLVALPAVATIDQDHCLRPPAKGQCILKITRFVNHSDYWTHAFDVPAGGNANVRAASTINVTSWYVSPVGAPCPCEFVPTNRSALILGLERDPGGTLNPRVDLLVTLWADGVHGNGYVRVAGSGQPPREAPLTLPSTWQRLSILVTFGGFVSISVTSEPDVDIAFTTVAMSLNPGTYRLFVIAPEARQIRNEVVIYSDKNLDTTDTRQTFCTNMAGFINPGSSGACNTRMASYKEWQGGTTVRTQGAEAVMGGAVSFTTSADLYGMFSPLPYVPGHIGINACDLALVPEFCEAVAVVPGGEFTAGRSRYAVEQPSGTAINREVSYPVCHPATCPGGPGVDPFLFFNCGYWLVSACQPSGTWTFRVHEHVAAGVSPDIVAVLVDVVPAT